MVDEATLLPFEEDLALVQQWLPGPFDVAIVLGSGLSPVIDGLSLLAEVSYESLVGMRAPTSVLGHQGRLLGVEYGGIRILVFEGRRHVYQGITAREAAYPVMLAGAAGASVVLLTNAAASLRDDVRVGDLVLITDHVNLLGDNALRGWAGPEGGTPFIPMAGAYDSALAAVARRSAGNRGIELKDGVYVAVPGPSYETRAEARALRMMGADVVGMSTVPEVVVARALGVRVCALSAVSNIAGAEDLSHEDVLDASRRAAEGLRAILFDILHNLATA